MNKLNIMCFRCSMIMNFCLMIIASDVFAGPENNQVRSLKWADNDTKPAMPANMMPSKNLMQTSSNEEKDKSNMTLIEILSNDSSFSILVKALKAADLNQALDAPGPFTLFAPNDQAIAKLSPNTLSDLMNPNNKEKLTSILTYHVVPGKIAEDKLKTMKLKTLQGKSIDIKIDGDKQTVNNAKIIGNSDVGSNGVIYVIDTVLMP